MKLQSPQSSSQLPALRLTMVLFFCALAACAKAPSPAYSSDGRLVELPEGAEYVDILSLPGEPILQLPHLLIEEVPLPQAVVVLQEDGGSHRQHTAWRLTVSASQSGFGVGALPWVIWVANAPLLAVESPDLTKLSAITFDGAMIHPGAEISVSYGIDFERRSLVAVIPSEE